MNDSIIMGIKIIITSESSRKLWVKSHLGLGKPTKEGQN